MSISHFESTTIISNPPNIHFPIGPGSNIGYLVVDSTHNHEQSHIVQQTQQRSLWILMNLGPWHTGMEKEIEDDNDWSSETHWMRGQFAFLWVLLFLFSMSLEVEDLTDDQWLKSTEGIPILAEVIVWIVTYENRLLWRKWRGVRQFTCMMTSKLWRFLILRRQWQFRFFLRCRLLDTVALYCWSWVLAASISRVRTMRNRFRSSFCAITRMASIHSLYLRTRKC